MTLIDSSINSIHWIVVACLCSGGESDQDVGVEGALQTGTVDVFKLLHQLALEGSIVDQHINATPLAHSLIYNLPAETCCTASSRARYQ